MFGRARYSVENCSRSGWKLLDWSLAKGDYVYLRGKYNFLIFTIRQIILLPIWIPALALYMLFVAIIAPIGLIYALFNNGHFPKFPWED